MVKLEVSVVLPTYKPDRRTLERVLHALATQAAVERERYEVIVVENPERSPLVPSLCRHYGFRYELSEKLGANAARNHGTSVANGEFIGLLDDDTEPTPTWVSRLLAVHGFFPKVGIVGGKLALNFLSPKPRWIEGAFRLWLSEVDWPTNGFTDIVNDQRHIVSGNMTYRKSIWEKAGGFPEWAGLRGREVLTVNDEPEFIKACARIGNPQVGYDPDLVAHHLIPPARATLDYMKARAYGQGYADGRDWVVAHHADRCLPDIYYHHVQHQADNFLYFGEVSSVRQRISHEESTREYLRNIIICRVEYFRGMLDAIERDSESIWQCMDRDLALTQEQ